MDINNKDVEIKRSLSFEDVKNSEIEIFENRFEVNFSEKYIEDLKALKIEDIDKEEVFTKLKVQLNLILNDEKAYDKIAESYKNHENKEFGVQTFIKVMAFIFNEFNKEISNIKGTDYGAKNLYSNREQRRYDKPYQNRGYNKGYRRY